MQTKKFRMTGITDYVFSKFSEEPVPKTEEQKSKSALAKVYVDDDGYLFIPSRQIKSSIKTAIDLADMKIRKSKIKAMKLIDQLVFIEPRDIHIMRGKKNLTADDVYLFDAPTKVTQGKMEKIVVVRNAAIKSGYELEFELRIFADNILDMSFLDEAIKNSELLSAIGGKRNQGFGKYEVLDQ